MTDIIFDVTGDVTLTASVTQSPSVAVTVPTPTTSDVVTVAGSPGAAGDSAYDVAVANGFVGTEAEWLASLVGSGGGGGADWVPADFNLTAWSFSPLGISARDTAMFNGALTLIGIKIPAAMTVTSVHNFIVTPGVNLTAGFGALYQSGNLLAVTADQSTAWATTPGRQTMALASPQAVNPGMVYVGFWSVGDTPPSLGVLSEFQQAFAKGINRFAIDLGSYPVSTTAPATLGSLIDGIGYWAAVS